MSDTNDNTQSELSSDANQAGPSELDMLKQRADLMGVPYSNNIGIDTLRQRIEEKLAGNSEHQEGQANPLNGETAREVKDGVEQPVVVKTLRQYLLDTEMALIRVRITNMDPKKSDLPGEIITVANEYLGTVSRFIPFGEQTDDGWHVPKCIYTFLEDRKFLMIKSRKNKQTGQLDVTQQWVREFALEILDPLTPAELQLLGMEQKAAGVIQND